MWEFAPVKCTVQIFNCKLKIITRTHIRFEVLMAVKIYTVVMWAMTPSSGTLVYTIHVPGSSEYHKWTTAFYHSQCMEGVNYRNKLNYSVPHQRGKTVDTPGSHFDWGSPILSRLFNCRKQRFTTYSYSRVIKRAAVFPRTDILFLSHWDTTSDSLHI